MTWTRIIAYLHLGRSHWHRGVRFDWTRTHTHAHTRQGVLGEGESNGIIMLCIIVKNDDFCLLFFRCSIIYRRTGQPFNLSLTSKYGSCPPLRLEEGTLMLASFQEAPCFAPSVVCSSSLCWTNWYYHYHGVIHPMASLKSARDASPRDWHLAGKLHVAIC